MADVHGAIFGARWVVQIHGGHAEHLTCAFCITPRDDGRVQLVESPFVEERVHRVLQGMPNAEHRAKRVGAETQVGLFPEEIQAVSLHLDGELFGVGATEHGQGRHLELRGLASSLALHQLANRFNGGSCVELLQHLGIRSLLVDHQLQILQGRAVIHGEKTVVAERANPPANAQGLAHHGVVQQKGNARALGGLRIRHVNGFALVVRVLTQSKDRVPGFPAPKAGISRVRRPIPPDRRATGQSGGHMPRCPLRGSRE